MGVIFIYVCVCTDTQIHSYVNIYTYKCPEIA